MKKRYSELMEYLLRSQGRYPNEEEFRAFLRESVRGLARDLKDFNIEMVVVRDTRAEQAGSKGSKALKIGCE